MTIAAGFRFADGLLLCADTQITSPSYMKLNDPKIVAIDFVSNGGSKAAFALTGTMAYCRMAVEHCRRKLAERAPNQMSSLEMMVAIEEALEGFCQDHLYKHPAFERGEIQVQMLVGMWSHLDNTLTLLATVENAVTVVRDYECLGAGQYLAHYLIPTLFRHDSMAQKDAANIALHVLKETKEHVDTCGGGSQLIVLRNDGNFSSVGYSSLRGGEMMSAAYKDAVRRLLVVCGDLATTDEQLQEEFDTAELTMRAARKQLIASNEKDDGLMDALAKLADATFERWIIRS